jgi:transcriptional regulator with XRE-family HTH domain
MTYISNNLHDCYLQEKPRAEIARQVAEFEARKGRVETMPMVKRLPDTRVDFVIRADVEQKVCAPKRRRGRPKGSSTCAPVAMIHDIKARMEKSGVRQKQVADAMGVARTYIGNIFNGYHRASPAVAERILAEVIKLESAPPQPVVRGRGYPQWARREEMLELVKFHGLKARAISAQCNDYRVETKSRQSVRVAEFLAGRKTPHPNLARMMERVILQMIGEKK